MMATLSQTEIVEAIKEWCDKRGVPATDDVTFWGKDGQRPDAVLSNVYVQLRGITMPVKEGPYR